MRLPTGFAQADLTDYWDRVADETYLYHGAYSTQVYFEQEKRLIQQFCSPLKGKTLLKTDLWNEAKNTRILRWVADQEAVVHGLDISVRVARQALASFHDREDKAFLTVADVRDIPYPDESFDFVYSMGTVEHFPDYEKAIREIYRVLKTGGTALIGVPNKFDIFLRPLQVFLLQKLGLYAFGYEKAFSKGELTRLLTRTNFKIRGQSSLLFMPGVLRMIDLFFSCHIPFLCGVSKALLAPFAFLYERFELFRRHGYLITLVVRK
jgi:SAM-dependent methyltransferase